MAKVGNSRRGLGDEISTFAAHGSIGNLLDYGFAVTGSAAAVGDFGSMDAKKTQRRGAESG